jgi:hypothetical protein
MGLTKREITKLNKLATKAGFELPDSFRLSTHKNLSRDEIQHINDKLIQSNGEAIVVVRKNGCGLRIYTIEGYTKQSAVGTINIQKYHDGRRGSEIRKQG